MPQHTDPLSAAIFWIMILLTCGIIGRFIAERFRQPGVLGEICMGILLGNILYYFHVPLASVLRDATFLSGALTTDTEKVAYILDNLSRIGIIFLLFLVGLESSLTELRQTGREALSVAMIGVILPMILGFAVMKLVMPMTSIQTQLFVAATLSATSVGITARVLKELHQTQTREARTILSAAMIDDVLGLIVLSVVSSLVIYNTIKFFDLLYIILGVIIFFALVLWMGPWLIRQSVKLLSFLDYWEAKLLTAFIFLMVLAWGAALVNLATIIGAFAAGVILNDAFFENHRTVKNRTIKEKISLHTLMAPITVLLAPLFFMLMGMQVKLEMFMSGSVVVMTLGLFMAACLGKLLAGLGASRRTNRWMIGIGMLPRGEVGLVFASVGKALNVMPDNVFSAIVLMILLTTLIVPPWLNKVAVSKIK